MYLLDLKWLARSIPLSDVEATKTLVGSQGTEIYGKACDIDFYLFMFFFFLIAHF